MPTKNISESSLPTTNKINPSDPSAEKGKLEGKDVMHIHKKVKKICTLLTIAALVTTVACMIIALTVYVPPYIAFTALLVTAGISTAIAIILTHISGVLANRIDEKKNQLLEKYMEKCRIEIERSNECLEAETQLMKKLEVYLDKETHLKHLHQASSEKHEKSMSLSAKLKEELSGSSLEEVDDQKIIELDREIDELKDKIITAKIECEEARIAKNYAEAIVNELEWLKKLAIINTNEANMAYEAVNS